MHCDLRTEKLSSVNTGKKLTRINHHTMGLLHMFHEGCEIIHNAVWCIHGTQPE